MKCSKCNKKINWDNSFGTKENLMCFDCFNKLVKENGNNLMKVLKKFQKTP